MRSSLTLLVAALAALAACANDPVYLTGSVALEVGVTDMAGNAVAEASAQHMLPIRLEKSKEAELRAERAAELGVEVPYVKVGDIEVSVEWTIQNLDLTNPGTATVQLNGANDTFAYDPKLIIIGDPDEPTPAPALDGDIPLTIGPGAKLDGLFREDQLREASIDLDLITRGNFNPFAATLQVHKNAESFTPLPMGDPIPREAFRQIIRVDLVFKADRHMTLDYTIRVRDTRGIMHELLDAAVTDAPGELTMFAPADFVMTYP